MLFRSGLEDQLNPAGEYFGASRIFRTIQKHCEDSPKALVDALFRGLDKWADGRPLTDDQTVVAMKVI